MDTATFSGKLSPSPYHLVICHSPVTPDILRFRGREALSEPFRWDIEFTTPPDSNFLPHLT